MTTKLNRMRAMYGIFLPGGNGKILSTLKAILVVVFRGKVRLLPPLWWRRYNHVPEKDCWCRPTMDRENHNVWIHNNT